MTQVQNDIKFLLELHSPKNRRLWEKNATSYHWSKELVRPIQCLEMRLSFGDSWPNVLEQIDYKVTNCYSFLFWQATKFWHPFLTKGSSQQAKWDIRLVVGIATYNTIVIRSIFTKSQWMHLNHFNRKSFLVFGKGKGGRSSFSTKILP